MEHIIAAILLPVLTATTITASATPPDLIPLPQKMECHKGAFRLGPETQILVDAAAKDTGQYLAARLRHATGFSLPIEAGKNLHPTAGDILLTTQKSKPDLGEEGYELQATPESVVIRAPAATGLFYGVESLLQLLPPEVFADNTVRGVDWTVPCVEIEDQPRFKWRGFMLDVSRHFFTKAEVKRVMDLMALHKLNVFHWHLVDDQGWRIEIKKYPKLTEVGAWRQGVGFDLEPKSTTTYGPDGRYGGYYTQADIRELVAYAQVRHITIVPEIEMPGHSVAALAAYPELSCSGGPFNIEANLGIFNGIYCAGNDQTFEFLSNVLEEVMGLFPGQYIHIGGDEVPKDNWQKCPKCQARMKKEGLKTEHDLQSYFIQCIEKVINDHGRTLIGWSEIREGGLAQNAAIMDWIGGAVEAASAGHDVVIATHSSTYLCYYQSLDRPPNLQAYRPCLPLEKVYSFEPVPAELESEFSRHILGAEACLWTPYFSSMNEIEEMSFPRLCALAGLVWSPKSSRNWDDFKRRLDQHHLRLDQCGVNYWRDRSVQIGEWKPAQIKSQGGLLEWDITKQVVGPGKVRVSLNFLGGQNGIRIGWAALLEDGHEISRDAHVGFTGTDSPKRTKPHGWNYFFNLPAPKKGARYSIRVSVSEDGGTNSSGVVFFELNPDITLAIEPKGPDFGELLH